MGLKWDPSKREWNLAGMHFSKQVAYYTLLLHHTPIQTQLTYGVWMFLFKSHKVFISFAYWQNSKSTVLNNFATRKQQFVRTTK